jgi:hypothetical protein
MWKSSSREPVAVSPVRSVQQRDAVEDVAVQHRDGPPSCTCCRVEQNVVGMPSNGSSSVRTVAADGELAAEVVAGRDARQDGCAHRFGDEVTGSGYRRSSGLLRRNGFFLFKTVRPKRSRFRCGSVLREAMVRSAVPGAAHRALPS